MNDQNFIIELSHISKSFGSKQVLNDVSLYVKKGEFVTILGPSGCGKTTLLRILAGFETASEGEIKINNIPMNDVQPHLRPVNTVFQRYALFPHLNVYDNIAFGLKLKNTTKDEIDKKVRRVLKMVGLTDYEWRDVSSLSGGQQQRVAIARAIVNSPQVLLLDEPLAALDLKMRRDMQMELKQMHDNLGITFVYVTHDQEEALTLSDRIVVMDDGVVQQIGTPTDIYNEPKNCFVADFIGESNILNGVMLQDRLVRFLDCDFECVDEGFGDNTPVDVVVRPEDIYIVPDPTKGQFSGKIISNVFKGVHYQMTVITDGGYELTIQDYNSFEVGSRIGMMIRPYDIQVMAKERLCNSVPGVMKDSNHVEMLGDVFECAPTDFKSGDEVTAEFSFDSVELMDDKEDGNVTGDVYFILYKGDHYHLTIRTATREKIYVNTNDVWDDSDSVGIRINPQDIKVIKTENQS